MEPEQFPFELATKKSKASFIIKNNKGLHTRPCTEIVRCAMQFASQILFRLDKNFVDAKSILSILTLKAHMGQEIFIEAVGDDADEAIAALLDLASKDFYISY